ncbi:MAG: hypothetical protein OEV92_13745, partial [Nitrospinota bacterium]|nr:hypothetical protein [Nitrospinota bacterium]
MKTIINGLIPARTTRLALLIALCLPAYSLLLTTPFAGAAAIESPERLLVGVYVNSKEEGNIDVLRVSGDFWIALEDFTEIIRVTVAEKEDALEFSTPLGAVSIPRADLGQFEGIQYISGAMLAEIFNIEMDFSSLDYALFFDVPWSPGAMRPAVSAAPLEPEISPTSGAVSFLRSYGEYDEDVNHGAKHWHGDVDLGGRLFGGAWIIGARGTNYYDPRLERYFWNRIFDRSVIRLGANYVYMNPLLTGLDFDGAQFAFNNISIDKYTDYASSFVQDTMLAAEVGTQINIIRDDGPPAGIAELRINDAPVAYVRVGLTGHYEFRNVERPQGVFQTIKIYLYQRNINETPLATVDLTTVMTGKMLSAGEFMLRAGAGRQRLFNTSPTTQDPAAQGLASARYGAAEWLTLEMAAQRISDAENEFLAGARMSLGR